LSDPEADEREKWISDLNMFQAAIRDVVLVYGTAEPVPVVVVHAVGESITDKIVDILARDNSSPIDIGHIFKDREPTVDNDHFNAPATGSEKGSAAFAQKFKQKEENDFVGVLMFHQAIYVGKLDADAWGDWIENENLYLTFPEGMREDGRCFIYITVTEGKGMFKRPITSIHSRLKLAKRWDQFRLEGGDDYYGFAGDVRNGGEHIVLNMTEHGIPVGLVLLTIQKKSIT